MVSSNPPSGFGITPRSEVANEKSQLNEQTYNGQVLDVNSVGRNPNLTVNILRIRLQFTVYGVQV